MAFTVMFLFFTEGGNVREDWKQPSILVMAWDATLPKKMPLSPESIKTCDSGNMSQ